MPRTPLQRVHIAPLLVMIVAASLGGCLGSSGGPQPAGQSPNSRLTGSIQPSCESFTHDLTESLAKPVHSSVLEGSRWIQIPLNLTHNQSQLRVSVTWASRIGEDIDVMLATEPFVGDDPSARSGPSYKNENGSWLSPDSPAVISAREVELGAWWVFVVTDEGNALEGPIQLRVSIRGECPAL